MSRVRDVRVVLPPHLKVLAEAPGEVTVEVEGEAATLEAVLEALEDAYPVLRGTIRDHGGGGRRPLMRFFACGRDLSHEPPGARLPEEVEAGREPLLVVGAIAGG